MEITKIYLQKKFFEYYKKAKFRVREIDRREWAFVPLKLFPEFIMNRHVSVNSYDELKAHILSNIPLHAYYSSAYYTYPDAEKMENKEWLGADLIFDIDSDHIPNVKNEIKALEIAKKEIIRLAEILKSDFGVDDLEIVFSGSRGYHIHVHDKEFLQLDSGSRREIVNYFTLNGIKFNGLASNQKERVCKCAAKLLVFKLKRDDFKVRVRKKTINSLKNKINIELLKRISNCDFSAFKKTEMKIINECLEKCIELLKIHIDEPVTADTHRLIRLPNSLHGKTGFIVKPLSMNEIENFNPFEDALAFGDEKVKIRCLKNIKIEIGGEKIKLSAGEKAKIPEFAAIYLICKKYALYGF